MSNIKSKILDKIELLIENKIHPDTLIISKNLEREMFLDDSFPKNINIEEKIEINKYLLNFITIDKDNVIKVLGYLKTNNKRK